MPRCRSSKELPAKGAQFIVIEVSNWAAPGGNGGAVGCGGPASGRQGAALGQVEGRFGENANYGAVAGRFHHDSYGVVILLLFAPSRPPISIFSMMAS